MTKKELIEICASHPSCEHCPVKQAMADISETHKQHVKELDTKFKKRAAIVETLRLDRDGLRKELRDKAAACEATVDVLQRTITIMAVKLSTGVDLKVTQ